MINTDATNVLWRKYLAPIVGRKAADLFVRHTSQPDHEFIDRVIRPVLFLEDAGTYVPVSDREKTPDRNADWAELIVKHPEIASDFSADPLQAMTFFANQLRIPDAPVVEEGLMMAERPSQRISVGPHLVLTLEFDVRDPAYLGTQIGWVSPRKNPLECPIGDFYKACSAYSDFFGVTVVYGGNKSLHIHVIFDTTLANEAFALGERSSGEVRRGYIQLWDRLHALFRGTVDTGGHDADRALRYPEQYRRLPGGIRVVGKDHILGIPEGTELPQITLWEKFGDRAGGDALFLTPDAFAPEADIESKKAQRYRAGRVGPMTAEQVAHCEKHLRATFHGWPRFVRLEFQGDRWVAKFANSPSDREPSSVMKEDYETIKVLGADAESVALVSLHAPLADMLRMWCEQMPGGNRAFVGDADLDATGKLICELEGRFAKSVIDKESAHDEMRAFFKKTVSNFALMQVVGPEGVGKTTSIFIDYDRFANRMRLRGESGRGIFAFASYFAAEEKCAKFNELQATNGFVGIVLPSFSRLYKEVCDGLGVTEITRHAAIQDGFRNLFEAVRLQQPKVVEALRKRHEAVHGLIGNKTPVFFVVHKTMHLWKTSSTTRLMWAKTFWTSLDDEDQEGRVDRLREETVVGLAVHDEVETEHIVEMHPEELARWVKKLTSRGPWRSKPRDQSECLKDFEDRLANRGAPIVRGKMVAITFDDVRKIESWLKTDPDPVIARDSGEYKIKALALDKNGDEQINAYDVAHGAEWRVSERDWWHGLAHQVILLTTEKVPTALVAATTSAWTIFELATPLKPKDIVEVYPKRSLTGERLPSICAEFRELHPDTYIISNKAEKAGVPLSMPHVTARGSNDLIGKNVMQTMTHMTPGQYEQLQVLNAWTGRSDLVGLHHIDEFNQSAGRNLGFRYHEGVTHTLLINRRLFRILATGTALGHSRYTLQPILDKDQRYGLKKASKGWS